MRRAGTIEFIADASEGLRVDRIWFMEMNTRLQVEHPVTEEITGVDLVEWQLRVASGEPLPKRQDELSIDGWAIEARLYAEDPAKGFLPSVGHLDHLSLPEGERIETGVREDDQVSPFYDPMIAKIVSRGSTRSEAISRLGAACEQVECDPVRTNAWFLARLLHTRSFQNGDVTTGFIAEHIDTLTAPPTASDVLRQVIADAIVLGPPFVRGHRGDIAFDMMDSMRGFRLNRDPHRDVRILLDGAIESVTITLDRVDLLNEGYARPTSLYDDGGNVTAFERGATFHASPFRVDGTSAGTAADGAILAPMPGRVTAVEVAAGDAVAKGQKLVTLEAMKMEHGLVAPFDGTVAELDAEAGQQVTEGRLLVRVERAGDSD